MYIPKSTYRLQFNSGFKFSDAEGIIDYLGKLGISDIYASPVMKARKGSMHGYDIVDPNQFNPEIGTQDDFNSLTEVLKSKSMGWIQDIVPNHMAYSHENQMLIDLFENGSLSRYYNFFDIEWTLYHGRSQQKVLAPFLGKSYQAALESGELKLNYDSEGFYINYFGNRFPLKMESYGDVLSYNFGKVKNKLGKNHPDIIKYLGILYMLKSFPAGEEQIDERYDQIKFIKGMLWEIYNRNKEIKVFVDETLKVYNGIPGIPESFNILDNLLMQQHYRLAFWKVANEEVNYRRFFNISDLISLRIENEETFNRIHSMVFKLIKENKINGVRVDHVDGLYDPEGYLNRLRDRLKEAYIIVEKILDFNESLPISWKIEGTTGYEFLNYVNGIFCRREHGKKFNSIYKKFTQANTPLEELTISKKKLIIETRLAGELERLALFIENISGRDRYGIDLTRNGLKSALIELLANFPVYRTYINKENYSEADRKYVTYVVEKLKAENPQLINEFIYIGNLLLMNYGDHFTREQKESSLDFIMRFQQLTGPLTAKGFEDTALYIYNRFISLNEVGGSPNYFGLNKKKFHDFNIKRLKHWPHSMNATSTHDTKRGEDTRARLNVLSEMPDEWNSKLKLWSRLNKKFKTNRNSNFYPDNNDEYFIYQALLGSFPFPGNDLEDFKTKVKEYIIKAVREAKVHTTWSRPNRQYEDASTSFIDKILSHSENNNFLNDFSEFAKKISFYGVFNSLSQTLLKITAPGVPDFYQGRELWDFYFVDPDNRRQVDYNFRKKILEEIIAKDKTGRSNLMQELLREFSSGAVKMFLIYKSLKSRNKNIDLFGKGEYIPLKTYGKHRKNIIAFARKLENKYAVSAVPRFLCGLVKENEAPVGREIWSDTKIIIPDEKKSFCNEITGEEIETGEGLFAGDLFRSFPSALLISSR
jgi:(1->4)-alpha-D-glucan 1-alpha-D-glucosylmutase